MGIGYTADTPLKVAPFGVDSVISLVDDILLEKLRKLFSNKYGCEYEEIKIGADDYRARRITSYLNLLKKLVTQKFEMIKNFNHGNISEFKKYLEMLPGNSIIKKLYDRLCSESLFSGNTIAMLQDSLVMGSIDVNIMTKLDKENYVKGRMLPVEYNDAHAALRGFANSDLHSSIVFSAGMNPKLFSYLEEFEDFYPNENGDFAKKITLKVSDFRSAMIQGRVLAKKGLWVSEFRIESGLNCGGHAFATDGFLLGPILDEFKSRRSELLTQLHATFVKGLEKKNRKVPTKELRIKFSAQGGVGTSAEHAFLLRTYDLDSIGWGTPFLLVPEATLVDDETLDKLRKAKEEDVFLSRISPLGVLFSNLRNNTKDLEKKKYIDDGRPGSPCPKKFASLNKEFTDHSICTASRQYQYLKIQELEKSNCSPAVFKHMYDRIVEKSCICVGLGTSALLANGLDTKVEGAGVSICPSPSIAYFSEIVSFQKMVDHIYGRANVLSRDDRPNMFIKELQLYIGYLKEKVEEVVAIKAYEQFDYLKSFATNLLEGIAYYKNNRERLNDYFAEVNKSLFDDFSDCESEVLDLKMHIETFACLHDSSSATK